MTAHGPLDQLNGESPELTSTGDVVAELRTQSLAFLAGEIAAIIRRTDEAGSPEPRDLACFAELMRGLEAIHVTEIAWMGEES